MGWSPTTEAPNRSGVGSNRRFSTNIYPWSGRTRNMSHVGFLVFLFYSSAGAQPATVIRFWWFIHHATCFRARKCFWGLVHTAPHFGVKSPKPLFRAWISTFKPNVQKILVLAYNIETTAPIPTKFCTVTKTIKYSSWVV